MTVRMIHVPGFCRYKQAVQTDTTRYHIHNALQGISQYGNRFSKEIGNDLNNEKENRNSYNYLLYANIYLR